MYFVKNFRNKYAALDNRNAAIFFFFFFYVLYKKLLVLFFFFWIILAKPNMWTSKKVFIFSFLIHFSQNTTKKIYVWPAAIAIVTAATL